MTTLIADPAVVSSVYNGKNGRCCCGCSGKHSYPTRNANRSVELRGYALDDEQVSDRRVANVCKVINAAYAADPDSVERGDSYVSHVKGERLYIAYTR